MVDTGSNITVLAARHAAALGLAFQESVEVNGTTGNARLPMATVNRLATGRTLKDRLRVAVLPDASMAREDGILGADVFAGKRLVFDIRDKVVNVEAMQRPT